MMSEKRFTIKPQDGYWAVVDNYNTVRIIDNDIEYDKVCIINGIQTEIEAVWLCDFMNEQHSIICRDEISIKTMMFNMEKLEAENEQLRKEKEYWEQSSKHRQRLLEECEKRMNNLQKDKEILKERLRECRIKMDKFNCR